IRDLVDGSGVRSQLGAHLDDLSLNELHVWMRIQDPKRPEAVVFRAGPAQRCGFLVAAQDALDGPRRPLNAFDFMGSNGSHLSAPQSCGTSTHCPLCADWSTASSTSCV